METEDFAIVEVGNTFSGDVGGAGDSVNLFSIEVSADKDCVVSSGLGKLGDEVNSDFLPQSIWYVQGLSEGVGVA